MLSAGSYAEAGEVPGSLVSGSLDIPSTALLTAAGPRNLWPEPCVEGALAADTD